jgi:hypothetical protein
MASAGFEESQAAYDSKTDAIVIGQFRRFGEHGPAYEIVRLKNATHADIRVVCSGEELEYRLDRLRSDPIAITIP